MRTIFLSSITIFLLPQVAFGQALVACTGVNCNFCSLAQTVDNVIEWLIAFMVVVAVILLAYAGIRMVISAGDTGAVQEAKTLFTNVVIGIIIILAAWMIVDTILKALTGSDMGVWNPVNCGGLTPAVGLLEYQQTTVTALEGPQAGFSLDGAPSAGCPTCADMSSFISCTNNCTADAQFAERLAGLSNVSAVGDLTVTEGYPPSHEHQAACHNNGTCVDIVFTDRNFTTDRVNTFITQAEALGFRAVYEPAQGGSCSGVSSCLPYSSTGATGNHFSLYAQ